MNAQEEVIIRGSPISKGIGIGCPVYFNRNEEATSPYFSVHKEVDEEINRYRKALDLSRKDLEDLQKNSLHSTEVNAILGTHLEIMKDPMITVGVEKKIRDTQQNTEWVFHHLIEEYKHRFSSLKSNFFQERIRDIVDISQRILGHLRAPSRLKISEVPHNSVILAHDLVPSETIEANTSHVSGFVTASGGLTSHTAIIARAKGIPYVANIDLTLVKDISIDCIIVDGGTGVVILNPKKATLKKYQELKKSYQAGLNRIKNNTHLKGETIDGYEVRIYANLENPKDIESILKQGASGIGLFRSEYLCFAKKSFPTEEEQFKIYKNMVKSMRGKPLVVRIYDLGGDKTIPELKETAEMNPALGLRGIRLLMRHSKILETQLRAILKASRFGEIHVLIPLVTDLSEIRFVRQKIVEMQLALQKEGEKFAKQIPLGCMIEVPSAALMSDAIGIEVDFLSIGTNDLVQYILAADRTNQYTSDLYHAMHPSVLRLIRLIVTHANTARKPLILCGEIASDPLMIPILLGFGISEFSVSSRLIPLVKDTIRQWRLLDACRLAEGALSTSSAQELKEYLQE
ncbi:MAG TPA: phosphoenolpyruvate--protein phosphotransferase [Chlamydiales bacterium]|nr:phosphoenolpyruvate--protein phosphotransferase [Chlamydiales bacterium]